MSENNVTENSIEHVQYVDRVECSICLEYVNVSEMITFCENSHSSCKSCYTTWKKKCLDNDADDLHYYSMNSLSFNRVEITCPTCRNMTLSCLVCREDFPIKEFQRPCASKNHYYCNDCLKHRIRRCSNAKLDTPCIVCRRTIYKYISGTFGPKLPRHMLKYSDKTIKKMREKIYDSLLVPFNFDFSQSNNQYQEE